MDDDPGWGLSWKTLPLVLVPALAIRRSAQRSGGDQLVVLRTIFIGFCAAIAGIGVVVVVLGDLTEGEDRVGLSLAVVVGAGILGVALQRFLVRPLDATSPATLAMSFRTRFFLRLAFSEASALVGFVADILFGPWWVYFVGAAFTVVGFVQLAPTRGHLAREQDALSLAGCPHSLVAALRSSGAS